MRRARLIDGAPRPRDMRAEAIESARGDILAAVGVRRHHGAVAFSSRRRPDPSSSRCALGKDHPRIHYPDTAVHSLDRLRQRGATALQEVCK
jgi:hypothetical protein